MSYLPTSTIGVDAQLRQNNIIRQVYAWMTAGLLVTGAVATYTANSIPLLMLILNNPFSFWVLLILELGLVFGLSAGINRMSPSLATALFLVYSAVNGLTFSVLFLIYTRASIASTFFITASMFAVMSLYGYTTKRDLTGIGSMLGMALIGFIIASLVNLFFHNPIFYWLVTFIGIIIFVGLTASDTQKMKRLSFAANDDLSARRVSIIGALMLYLDFINLFILLLRIFGRRR